ncbi:MAG: NAD(P)-dependent glycerol-3-phosphate dehydrogenase [Candidatus Zixiibacteriota bacterium]|nr:MAG: NAD(P)-dependent glycerol-3-phosphate dehydrogenase [candidate division Zixibacteria bacterium]
MPEKITVLGAGSWGIAIANLLHANDHRITMWEFNRADFEYLSANRTHPQKLPGIRIADEITLSDDLRYAADGADFIIFAVPAQKVRSVCEFLNEFVKGAMKYVNLAKGVEIGSLLRMSELINSTLVSSRQEHIATLSGPSHAEEVSRNIPTSVVVASTGLRYAEEVQRLFSGRFFRVYRSTDLVGVELGGALKNVIAIASGITQGLGFGDNTTGALLTRGLAEITRMGVKLGADPLTFAGLSGIGDLITTCVSKHSRNRHVGERIGKGEKLAEILSSMVMVAEGVDTCRSAYAMAEKHDVEMPITTEVFKILFEDKPAFDALSDLMGRSLKEEVWN